MNFLKKFVKRLRNKSSQKTKNKQPKEIETAIAELVENESDYGCVEDAIDAQEYIDDLELGEEAWTFNMRQQIVNMANYSMPMQMGSFYHQPTPSLSFFEKQGLPPLAPLIINQPCAPEMQSMNFTPNFMSSAPPLPTSFNFSTQASTVPGYCQYPYPTHMNYSPQSGSLQPHAATTNYLGLSQMETLELHHLLANGIPETEALQTIQNKRLLEAAQLASTASSFPRAGVQPLPDQIASVSANQSCNNHTDVTSEETFSLALQQYYDDQEKMIVVKPSSPASLSRTPSVNLSKPIGKISCNLNEAVNKANEEALKAGIAMSMKDANLSKSNRHQSPSMTNSSSSRFPNPPLSTAASNDSNSPRFVSYSTSKSSDLSSPPAHLGYGHHQSGGIVPDYCIHNQGVSLHSRSPRTVTTPYGHGDSERAFQQPSPRCQPPNAAKMILARHQYPPQQYPLPFNKVPNSDDSKHSSPRRVSAATMNNR